MKIWEQKFVTGGLAAAGLLFLVAALKPLLGGLPINVPFFLVGIVCLGLGIAGWRKSTGGGDPPTQ